MSDKDPPPDHLRCKRTDGRQWRCKRLAMEGISMCDIHHLQGKHRQNKQKVPDSLKLERTVTKKSNTVKKGSTISKAAKLKKISLEKIRKKRQVSEALDGVLQRLKLKRGDLQLELIRLFLKRQVEKKKEKERKEDEAPDETRKFQLPYGVMAITQSPKKFRESNGVLDVKLGVDSNGNSFSERNFRSKNIEPPPVGAMQVVPFADLVKKRRIKKCHLCRENKCRFMIKCLTCRNRFFCTGCIKERNLEKQEVKVKCPACRKTCSCDLCMNQQHKANYDKECQRSKVKVDQIQLLQYLIYMLLPVLKKIACDQNIELEREAKITGKKQSEIQISQTLLDSHTLLCCNRCKTSIVDYHRACTNCSYILCFSCCQEILQHCLSESFKLRSCKRRKVIPSGEELLEDNMYAKSSLQVWETRVDGSIPCPPIGIGGCGNHTLDLRFTFPFTWAKDVGVRAEEILCSYGFPEVADVGLSCLMCNQNNSKDCFTELSKGVGFHSSYLYCPTIKDLHQEKIEHFQNHWGKGHPVIVRNILRTKPGLCWDPVNMLCSYMESKCSESFVDNSTDKTSCSDWCEVEIDRKRTFMGSLEKRTHASIKQKFLKFKVWLSSYIFPKQFPLHYKEILSSLPLPEYINPVCGLLNVGAKLPEGYPETNLGPYVYFTYGSPDDLGQSDFLSKLHYEAHDMVNILAHASDTPVSPQEIVTVEKLLKRYNGSKHGKSSVHSEDTGESGLHDVGEKANLPNGNNSSYPFTGQMKEDFSEDTESDDEPSILCCGSIEDSEDTDELFREQDLNSTYSSKDKQGSESDSCGAKWDIFNREDVPKLLEYFKRHSNEFSMGKSYSKLVHPILDQSFFLDAYHKLKLKQEFDIQPWSFDQCPGEAIFIPAGCPYQIRKTKSCVNVVLDFISPESATHCIQLRDEIRALPTWHKDTKKLFEVEKMVFHRVNAAIEDLRNLAHIEQGEKHGNVVSRSKDCILFKKHNSGNSQ